MSPTQKFLLGLMPKSWAASADAESKTWFLRCPKCGHERSVWEMGGVKWKAAGKSYQLLKCPACGQTSWHENYKKVL